MNRAHTTIRPCRFGFAILVILTIGINATSLFGSINLAWDPASESFLVGYNVYRSTQSGVFTAPPLNGATPVTATAFTDSTAQNNQTYYYVVRAVGSSGQESANSNMVVAAPPDIVPPSVSITAPANGASVVGTTVVVSATASDNVGVVGVQFKLDGANLGAEDTASPYTFSWNTTTVSNGVHSLSAVARDAAGNQTTSATVSVSASTTMRIEETSAAITYSGTWSLVTNAGMYSGGTMKSSMDANAQATLSFTGTSVTFITMSDEWSGIAQIYVDGSPATQVDLYASPAIRLAKAYTVSGLTPGPHTVGIGPIGRKNATAQGSWVQVDAFDVTTTSNVTTTPSPAPTTISGVSGSGTSGSTATLTATLTSGGSGLSGKTIRFTLNGSGAGTAATNSSGVATLSGVSLSGINAGNYSTAVAANFAGDTSYAASSGSGALTGIASTSGSGTQTSGSGTSGSTTSGSGT